MCVYVLYHHECELAEKLSREIFDWLRGLYVDRNVKRDERRIDLQRLGLGIPVYYRTSFEDPHEPPGNLKIHGIDYHEATCNVIVPLIDVKMVNDYRWRRYLRKAAGRESPDTVVLPVALDSSAYRLDAGLGGRNFVRLQSGSLVHLLRRRLAEACLRALRKESAGLALDGDAPPRSPWIDQVKIFISHAKGDAREISLGYRNAVLNYGQLDAFFDENDIPYGSGYQSILRNHAAHSDAMLCIQSDLYSSRPWCQLELAIARAPRLVGSDDDAKRTGIHVYSTVPVVVVDHLSERPTKLPPDLGHVTVIRGKNGNEDLVLDILIREALLVKFQAATARILATMHSESPEAESTAFLSFVPDLTAIRRIEELRAESGQSTEFIVYPGSGLSFSQRSELERLSGLKQLTTFQQLNDEHE